MAKAFVRRFIMNSRRPKGVDSLMMMKVGDNESSRIIRLGFWRRTMI